MDNDNRQIDETIIDDVTSVTPALDIAAEVAEQVAEKEAEKKAASEEAEDEDAEIILPSDGGENEKEEMKRRIKEAQKKLGVLAQKVKEAKLPVIILFEGWGASGFRRCTVSPAADR